VILSIVPVDQPELAVADSRMLNTANMADSPGAR
jgi:hypothetical protein